MPTEIEHKYLVSPRFWEMVMPEKSIHIKQAYLLTDPNKTIRVRTKGNKAFITIKGKAIGASRPEFEYEIPVNEANELIQNFCSNVIEKIRHVVTIDKKIWEIDEFKGQNNGLVVAEIELASEDEMYRVPVWAVKEVTNDHRYANSSLSENPFINW